MERPCCRRRHKQGSPHSNKAPPRDDRAQQQAAQGLRDKHSRLCIASYVKSTSNCWCRHLAAPPPRPSAARRRRRLYITVFSSCCSRGTASAWLKVFSASLRAHAAADFQTVLVWPGLFRCSLLCRHSRLTTNKVGLSAPRSAC